MPRKVCWPDPDIICADGGCLYCESSKVVKGTYAIGQAIGGVPSYYIWKGGCDTRSRIPSYYYGAERVPYRYPRDPKRVREYERAKERGLVRWQTPYGDPAFDDLDC